MRPLGKRQYPLSPLADRSLTGDDSLRMHGRETPGRIVDHGLTERELEVLELLVAGSRDREIADRLGISTGTVRAHLAGARDKLGARSRVDVAVRALRSGIITLEPLELGILDDA